MAEHAAAACARIVGHEPDRVETPGGATRKSVRLVYGDRSIIASRRRTVARARLEARVLRGLNRQGAPAPRLLAFDGRWLFQQDAGGRRLTAAIHDAREADREAWLDAGVAALAACQRAAQAAGLARTVHAIGHTPEWLARLAGLPERIGRALDLPAPALDRDALTARIAPREAYLVKWDARPGNAAARDDGSVVWFDWEHCGVRNRLDDLVWYLADEYMPDLDAAEPEAMARWLPQFGADDIGAGTDYFCAFAVLHSLVRFHLVAVRKGDRAWLDHEEALAEDKVGRTAEQGMVLCRRAARWAGRLPETRPLVPWLEALALAVPRL